MRRCFLIVAPKDNQDISPLREIGRVVILYSKDNIPPSFYDPEFPTIFLKRMEEEKFNTKNDFLVGVGSSMQQVVASNALTSEYGEIQFLTYDPRIANYKRLLLGVPFNEC